MARHEYNNFGEAIKKFDVITPDGMPLLWAVNRKLAKDKKLKDRVYGPTLMLKTIEASKENPQFRHFFLGGKISTLQSLKKNLTSKFPEAKIAEMYSPPFGEWPSDEFENIKQKIIESKANIVWVGLGCPKQEQWIAKYKEQLPNAVYFGIGAAFAFHAGEVKQAPEWIQKISMEWLYRLCKEPRRLWKRYFTYNFLFVWYFLMRNKSNKIDKYAK